MRMAVSMIVATARRPTPTGSMAASSWKAGCYRRCRTSTSGDDRHPARLRVALARLPLQERLHQLRIERAAHQEALDVVAALVHQEAPLLGRLHALGDHLDLEGPCERQHRARDRAGVP